MSRKLLFASLAGSVGFAALIVFVMERNTVHRLGVSDFLNRDVRDTRVVVQGKLVPGTLCSVEPDCGFRFGLADPLAARSILPVAFEGCVMPDSFLEHPDQSLDVVVDGQRCQTCHDFQATTVLTRSYGKYDYPTDAGPIALPLPPRCDTLRPRM